MKKLPVLNQQPRRSGSGSGILNSAATKKEQRAVFGIGPRAAESGGILESAVNKKEPRGKGLFLVLARVRRLPAFFLLLSLVCICVSCVSRRDVQAEEYFSIGMAYYEMGKYADAEKWLNRARGVDKTMTASEYNLGRIAFETGRYAEAARHFERILNRDPENVMALKAAAYSRIKNGDLKKAETLYDRVLVLVPESADDGFNYALVLYGLEKFSDCEAVLNKYPYAQEENASSILLLARAQKAQNKIEAADSYAKWAIISGETVNPQGLYEYAQVLEAAGFYARALEQYQAAVDALDTDTEELKKSTLRFEKARLILTADPESSEGIKELTASADEGFSDTEAIEALLNDERITKINRDEIQKILEGVRNKETQAVSSENSSEDTSLNAEPEEKTEASGET